MPNVNELARLEAESSDSRTPNRQDRSTSAQLNDHFFGRDNFASRRTTGHNLYDPESLITGAEVAAGLTYHDKRDIWWKFSWDEAVSHYTNLCNGKVSPESIAKYFPRVRQ